MLRQPSRILVQTANRLAQLLDSEDGVQALRLLAQIGLNSDLTQAPPKVFGAQDSASRIGIWENLVENGKSHFVRTRKTAEQWWLWAECERIEPKTSPRVVLLGESVARGFLYDPYFNPARALRKILQTVSGTATTEVIDLARHDCSPELLLTLAEQIPVLQADAVIVFAGNNWNPYGRLNLRSLQEIAYLLRTQGSLWSVKEYLELMLKRQAESFVDAIAEISKTHSFPTVLIIPEFNLADWRTDCSAAVAFLELEQAAEWRSLAVSAEKAFCSNDLREAATLAARMTALDGGSTSLPLEILGRYEMVRGDVTRARHFLEQARDTTLFVPGADSPRCFSAVQTTLRTRAVEKGLELVDLRHRFTEYLNGIPDHHLFLDYCHLTADGIRVAMASAAEQLMPALRLPPVSWRDLAKTDLAVDSQHAAEAHFFAAIHNAHWRQRESRIRSACLQAVRTDGRVSRAMLAFVDYYCRRCPSALCRSFQEVACESGRLGMNYLFQARHRYDTKIFNPSLLAAVVDVLKPDVPELEQRVSELLRSERGVGKREVDLLELSYWCDAYSQREFLPRRGGHFKAYARESNFRVGCDKGQQLNLTFTYRVPSTRPQAVVSVRVNNSLVTTLIGQPVWQTQRINVCAELVIRGMNTIAIIWPDIACDVEPLLPQMADNLEIGNVPEIYQLYGEIHCFRIATVSLGCDVAHYPRAPSQRESSELASPKV